MTLLGGGIGYFKNKNQILKECKAECIHRVGERYVSPLSVWEHQPTAQSLSGQEGYFSTQKECLNYCVALKTDPKKLDEFKRKEELEEKQKAELFKYFQEMNENFF